MQLLQAITCPFALVAYRSALFDLHRLDVSCDCLCLAITYSRYAFGMWWLTSRFPLSDLIANLSLIQARSFKRRGLHCRFTFPSSTVATCAFLLVKCRSIVCCM